MLCPVKVFWFRLWDLVVCVVDRVCGWRKLVTSGWAFVNVSAGGTASIEIKDRNRCFLWRMQLLQVNLLPSVALIAWTIKNKQRSYDAQSDTDMIPLIWRFNRTEHMIFQYQKFWQCSKESQCCNKKKDMILCRMLNSSSISNISVMLKIHCMSCTCRNAQTASASKALNWVYCISRRLISLLL